MRLFAKRYQPDGRGQLTPRAALILSCVVTGLVGALVETIGPNVFEAYEFPIAINAWIALAIWAFGIGPMIWVLRRAAFWVPMAVVFVSFIAIDLANHFVPIEWVLSDGWWVDSGRLEFSRFYEWVDGEFFGLRHPLAIAFLSSVFQGLFTGLSIFLQRVAVLWKPVPKPTEPSELQRAFAGAVDPPRAMKPKRDFGFAIMICIALAYGGFFSYLMVVLATDARTLPGAHMFFVNPTQTVNSFMKLLLMASLSLVGAYNVRIRRPVAILLIVGHMVSVIASGIFYIRRPSDLVYPEDPGFLMSSLIADGVIVLFLLVPLLRGRRDSKRHDLTLSADALVRSPASVLQRAVYIALATVYGLTFVSILIGRFVLLPETDLGAINSGPDPLISNSLTKYLTLCAIFSMMSRRTRMRRFLEPSVVFGLSVTILGTVLFGLQGTTEIVMRDGPPHAVGWYMMVVLACDGLTLATMLWLRRFRYHTELQVSALGPASSDCVMALHSAYRETEQEPEASTSEVLRRLDEHLVGIKGRLRGLMTFPFGVFELVFPMACGLRPPFSTMSREEQRWMLRRYVCRPPWERMKAQVPPLADVIHDVGQVAHGLVTLAYFSSPAGHQEIGYVLPERRARLAGDLAADSAPGADKVAWPSDPDDPSNDMPSPAPNSPMLRAKHVGSRADRPALPTEVDYCVIGSGAAGAVVAYRLAQSLGQDQDICMVERGRHFAPRADFVDDEMVMIRRLLTEGGLQAARDFQFTILQGECVGGSTVINNAICYRPPAVTREDWANYGIDLSEWTPHFDQVGAELQIAPVPDHIINQRVRDRFTRGVSAYNQAPGPLGPLSGVAPVDGNFKNCLGCGLCVQGCRHMRKLSALETYVPWSLGRGVQLLANTSAVSCETAGGDGKRVTGLIVRDANGDFHRIGIRKALVVSAGAVASSRFLMRSGLGGPHVGQGLSCNYAFAPLVEFDESIDGFDGLQMSLYAAPESHDAMLEVTFNPPGTYSILHAFHFERHRHLMAAYRNTSYFAAIVRAEANGSIRRRRDPIFGHAVEWPGAEADRVRLSAVLRSIAQIARGAGGKRIHIPTLPALTLPLDDTTDARLAQLERYLVSGRHFNLATAHPQGGNKMASQSHEDRVVNLDFRVRGAHNLFVCDASVFPTSSRVNPQWTIMAAASAAAQSVLEHTG